VKKAIMVAGVVLFLIVLVICGFPAHRILSSDRPAELTSASVVSGPGLFSKQAFYNVPDLGLITDIQPRRNHELVVAGKGGAVFLTEEGAARKLVHFTCRSDVTALDVAGGAFLCRGGWIIGAALFDAGGQTLWSFREGGIEDSAAGSLDAPNTIRVAVGLTGDGGVHLLNSDGKELWKQEDGNVWHVEIAAADDRSDKVILHSNAAGQLTIRDAAGKVLARHTPDVYLADFSLTAWNDDPRLSKLITARDGTAYVMTQEGTTLARLPAPNYAVRTETKGTPVRFSSGPPYYAGLFRLPTWSRALLYIYNDHQQLIYEEILGDECAALQAVPGKNGKKEDLLVGCNGAIWKYSAGDQLSGSN
jgi:hypothetical protein